MNVENEELSINYEGQDLSVTAYTVDANTVFSVHLPENDLQLRMDYIDDIPVWVEGNGEATDRSQKIGRLIEEFDGR